MNSHYFLYIQDKILYYFPHCLFQPALVSPVSYLLSVSQGGKVQWFFTQNLAGGGDGEVIIAVTKNKNYERTVDAEQYILTSDSTIMYKLVFGQKGEKD